MVEQEMTPVQECKSTNAPSRETEDYAYKKGYNQALCDFEDSINEHFRNGHETLTCYWIIDTIKNLKETNNV